MLHHPNRHTPDQIERASQFAAAIGRGRFVVCEPPRRIPLRDDLECRHHRADVTVMIARWHTTW